MNKCIAVIILSLAITGCLENENWKQRWIQDTAAQEQIIKESHQKVTELSLDLSIAEAAIQACSQQVKSLVAENEKLITEVKELKEKLKNNAQTNE